MKSKFFIFFVMLGVGMIGISPKAQAACTGSSPTWRTDTASLGSCIMQASSGDTIYVSSGSVAGFTITKHVAIIGGDGGGTTTVTGNWTFKPVTTNTDPARLSNLTITGTLSLGDYQAVYVGIPIPEIRVDHCTFTSNSGYNIQNWSHYYGAIDHNTFGSSANRLSGHYAIWSDPGVYDSATNINYSWFNPSNTPQVTYAAGDRNNLFFEDNIFWMSNSSDYGVMGTAGANREVFRYNTIYGVNGGPIWECHGFQAGSMDSIFGLEVYGNIQIGGDGHFTDTRGGTLRAFYNVSTAGAPSFAFYMGAAQQSCPPAQPDLQMIHDAFGWNNRNNYTGSLSTGYISASTFSGPCGGKSNIPTPGRDYNIDQSTNPAVGMGVLANRPSNPVLHQGYWATDQSTTDLTAFVGDHVTYPNNRQIIQGTFYWSKTTAGSWDTSYTPYTYPHPLVTPSTPDTEPPTSPTNLSTTATSQSSITVSWNPATDNVAVTGYIVERCQGSGCSNFAQVGTPSASPFIDIGLTPNTVYNYHVRATDAAGNLSGWSNVVGATTQAPDTAPPSAPTSLTVTVSSSNAIDLSWTASTDNVAVANYLVERCSSSGCTNFSQITSQPATSYQDTGLSASTLYRYRVRATDAANNNSNYSNIAEATTPQAPPTPTFISEYETAWNSATSPKTTSNFSVQSGDILVAYAVNESSTSTIATPPTGTLTGTWTLRQTISATNFTALRLWSMNVTSNQNNVNVSFTNASGNWGADVLHFRNASSVGITAQANSNTGNPTLTLNGVEENSSIVMVNGDWSAKTGARTYNTTQAGSFTETSAFADGTSYGVEAGYYANAGASGNKTIGLTAPTGMTWALAALEVKGNPTAQPISCNTVTTANFSQAAYNSYGAPFDAFQTSTNLIDAKCTSADTHTVNLTTGVTGDTTRIVYTKGYWYDAVTTAWRQYTGTCTGALNGEWCQGSVSATITDANVSTASSTNPTYLVGMTCSVQGGSWKCGCRDTNCTNFSWQIQGAGL